MERKFIKKDTRVFSLVTSVLLGVALILLVIASLFLGNFLSISLVGSAVIVFISSFFMGAMQIRVFSNYKSQKKYLCADGIFYICLTVLVALSSLMYLIMAGNSKIDLRYLIFVFAVIFAVWKIIIAVIGFKNKHYNAFAELILAFFWLLSGIGVLLTISEGLTLTGTYIMTISNYLLGISSIFYILFSYIFKEPNFLVTEKAIAIYDKEESERMARINRFNSRYEQPAEPKAEKSEPEKKTETLEDKLTKLQNLKEKGFLTDEEFEKRKQALLDEEL